MTTALDHEKIIVYLADDDATLSHHYHNAYELIFIVEGEALFTVDGREMSCGPGAIVFLSDLEQHQMRPTVLPYRRYVAILKPAYFDKCVGEPALCSIFKRRPLQFSNAFSVREELRPLMRDLLESCMGEWLDRRPFWENVAAAQLVRLLAMLYRSHPDQFPAAATFSAGTVQELQGYLDTHYLEELNLDVLAEVMHMNKYHLCHIYREGTGYTIKQYLLLKRISHAKALLYHTEKDISQVAADSGFHSASNFIRAFKNREGITPARYKALL